MQALKDLSPLRRRDLPDRRAKKGHGDDVIGLVAKLLKLRPRQPAVLVGRNGNRRRLSGAHFFDIRDLPGPERGYVLHIPEETELGARNVVVQENGLRVTGVRVDPLASSGLRFGVVLALDASDSMAGRPAAAAIRAARAFVAHRATAGEVGVVAFNRNISVLRDPTTDGSALRRALEPVRPPASP